MRRWLILLQLGGLGLGLSAAVPPLPPTAPIEIEIPIFVGGYGAAFFEQTARQFEAQRPGLRVNLYGDPRIVDKVRIRAIEGSYPDATDADLLWPNLIRAGAILDLAPYLDEPAWVGQTPWRETFVPGALERWTDTDATGKTHVWAVPFAHAAWTIFYNKGLFRAHGWTVPQTWAEFFALCENMPAAGVAPLAFPGVYLRYGDSFLRAAHYNLVGAEGYRAYNELAPGTRSDPRFVRAAGVVQRITANYLMPGWQGMTHTAAQLAFLQGQAAMTVSGSWFVNEMKGRFPEGFELGAMNFPVFADGITDPSTLQTGSGHYFLFASGDPAREAATVDFFRYLTSRERAEAFAREIDSPSAVRGVPREAFSVQMRDTADLIAASQASYGQPPGSVAFQAVIASVMTDARHDLMMGRITPEAFGARLEAAAAAERARAADPERVEVRHGWATAGLLGVIFLGVAGLAWRSVRRARLSGGGGGTASDNGGALGRLRAKFAVGFVGPALLLYGGLVLAPAVASFGWAFTRWDGIGVQRWAGWFNFKWLLLESDGFWAALGNNLYLMLVPALVVVPTALFFAGIIHRGVPGGGFMRVVLLFPNILGGIAATLLWMSAYDSSGGLVNEGLVALGGLVGALPLPGCEALASWLQGFAGHAWLSQDNLYSSLIPIYLWMACGFNLVLYLAAMESIPADLYEAAELDGASKVRQFFVITLPLIWEVLVISAVFLVIGGLNAFEMIWLLTAQDPSTGTHTLSTLMVSTMFKQFQIGRATAIAVVMFLLVLATSAAVMRGLKRETVER